MAADPASTPEPLLQSCRAEHEPMLALLRELVELNSHTENRQGGALVAQRLADALDAIDGVEVTLHRSERFAPHLSARTAAARHPQGAIALVGHLDTVFPPGTFEGFRLEGPLAHGPGVLDMKGGLVLVVHALAVLARHGVLERTPVRVLIVSDEEVGSPESAELLERELAGAACALVFESGRDNDGIVTARKGTGGLHVVATGKAAHAGNRHEAGANAIWALARLVDRVQALTDYERGITVNVGVVRGGIGRNTVPDRAEALVDLRFVHASDGAELVRAVEQAAREAERSVPGTRVALSGGVARPPLERTEANVALCLEYGACARASGLGDGEAPLQGGGSDASTAAALGIPAIDGLGPRGSGFHTHEERIEIGSLVPKLEALVRFLWGRSKLDS